MLKVYYTLNIRLIFYYIFMKNKKIIHFIQKENEITYKM